MESRSKERPSALLSGILLLAALFLPGCIAPILAPGLSWRLNSTITRLMMVGGLFWLIWRLKVPAIRQIKESLVPANLKTVLLGLSIAVLICALYTALLIQLDAESLRPTLFRPDRILMGLLTGLVVSTIEEPVFRGSLLRRPFQGAHFYRAAILSSFLYALAHYIRPDKVPLQPSYDLVDSFQVYRNILTNLAWKPIQDPVPGMSLFLLGMLLCVIARRGGLPWTIGIHAGLVFFLKANPSVIYWNHAGRHFWFGSANYLYDGMLFCILCSTALILTVLLQGRDAQRPKPSET